MSDKQPTEKPRDERTPVNVMPDFENMGLDALSGWVGAASIQLVEARILTPESAAVAAATVPEIVAAKMLFYAAEANGLLLV